MAFTVTFPATAPPVPVETLCAWLTERGEPFAREGEETLALRALPLRFVSAPGQASLQAQLDVTPTVPLSRLVDVLFEVSMRAGADVNLAGHGPINRPELWMRLADEQDRLRLAAALHRAREHGQRDEIHRRLWALIASLRPGHDDRWDTTRQRIVEWVEVGDAVSVEEARWHAEDPKPGDAVPVPVQGFLHCLAWRWLSEAWPGIAEAEHTLH